MRFFKTQHAFVRVATVSALAGALALTSAPSAYADLSSDLSSARAQLEEIGTQASALNSELDTLSQKLEETGSQIATKQEELAQNQETLSNYMSSSYKGGGNTLISVLSGVSSIDEVFSRLFYVGKVAESQQEAIENVKTAKQDLEATQAEQQKNVEETQAKVDALNAQRTAAANLVSSLDSQMQEQLAAEAAQNAALEAALTASQEEQLADVTVSDDGEDVSVDTGSSSASTTQKSTTSTTTNGGTTTNTNSGTTTNTNSGTTANTNSGTTTNTTPKTDTSTKTDTTPKTDTSTKTDTTTKTDTSTSDKSQSVDGGSVVSRAYSKIGVPYLYGACSPSAFDCSGFVSYCLTGSYSRIGTTYTFMGWSRVSNPQPGDVVTDYSHCGIYIGGGQMIHASYSQGVMVSPVWSSMIYVRY